MINLITGVPGAGKTYFAVYYIYLQLISKNSKYKSVYTNINLNFKKCDEIKKDFVKPLILDVLLKRIELDYILSEKFKNNNLFTFNILSFSSTSSLALLKQVYKPLRLQVTDYDAYVRDKLNLFVDFEHSLIILDECHFYFTEQVDPKMLRFLSYHRHFDIDMYLITQNKSLINRKYLAFVENMYIGVNPSKRLFSKTFVYKLYASWKEYKSNYVGKEKLKFDKKIADLYNSGSNQINKSFAFRLIFPFIVLSFVVFFIYIAVSNYLKCGSVFGCSVTRQKNNFLIKKQILQKDNFHKNSYTQKYEYSDITNYKYFYKLQCFKFKCVVNNSFSLSYSFIKILPKISDTLIFLSVTTSYGHILYISTNLDLNKFNPNKYFSGGKNEKDILSINSDN